MKLLKLVLAGIILAIVAQVIHTIGAMLSMSYYTDPGYSAVWSKIMMPSAGPPPASFMYTALAFGFIGMFLFALVYSIIKSGVPGNSLTSKGIMYGLLIILVATIPGYLSLALLINLPLNLILMWTVESGVIALISGIVVAWVNP